MKNGESQVFSKRFCHVQMHKDLLLKQSEAVFACSVFFKEKGLFLYATFCLSQHYTSELIVASSGVYLLTTKWAGEASGVETADQNGQVCRNTLYCALRGTQSDAWQMLLHWHCRATCHFLNSFKVPKYNSHAPLLLPRTTLLLRNSFLMDYSLQLLFFCESFIVVSQASSARQERLSCLCLKINIILSLLFNVSL